jgi:ribonuclease HI
MSTMIDIYVFNKRRGWAAILAQEGHIVDWRCGVVKHGSRWTSMLTAVIEALNAIPSGHEVTLHMDYKCRWFFGALATMSKWKRDGWRLMDEHGTRPLPNAVLWRRLDKAMERVSVTLAEIHGGRDYHVQQLTRTLARETLAGKTVNEILSVDRFRKVTVNALMVDKTSRPGYKTNAPIAVGATR